MAPPSAAARQDPHSYFLWTGQAPLCATQVQHLVEDTPSTTQAVVAVMCYGGMGQEDAVILKKQALGRVSHTHMEC